MTHESSGISGTRITQNKFGYFSHPKFPNKIRVSDNSGYRFFAQPYAHSLEALTAIRVLLACQFTSANAYYIELASIE